LRYFKHYPQTNIPQSTQTNHPTILTGNLHLRPHQPPPCTLAGASATFSRTDPDLTSKVVSAILTSNFTLAGIIDPISTASSYAHTLSILSSLSSISPNLSPSPSNPIWISGSHPPPPETEGKTPEGVKAGMFYAVSDIAVPVWQEYVGEALERVVLRCLPEPLVVGKGLEFVREGLRTLSVGVSGKKVVIDL